MMGWKPLFDGKSLEGWKASENKDTFTVRDGEIVAHGQQYSFGLEAGSKPELLAVLAMLDSNESLIICNGYKDDEYIEMALLATKIGKCVVLVVEKFSELPIIVKHARRLNVVPRIGVRARLSSRPPGRSPGVPRPRLWPSCRPRRHRWRRQPSLLVSRKLHHSPSWRRRA